MQRPIPSPATHDATASYAPSAKTRRLFSTKIGSLSSARIIATMDTGVDDAMAICYLLASPRCELAGVVAGYGNVAADTAFRNTRAVLDLFGRADIPVFRGCDHPSWADSFIPDAGCAQFHGVDGLGGTGLADAGTVGSFPATPHESPSMGDPDKASDDPTAIASRIHMAGPRIVSVGGYPLGDPHANPAGGAADTTDAAGMTDAADAKRAAGVAESNNSPTSTNYGPGVDFLIDQVRRYGHGITVLATGPLTDVDVAITAAPDIIPHLRLVMMGGSLTQPGNCWDAVAETNVIQDPEAADRVFHSGADITMVGLDVTHRCLLPSSAADQWRATGTRQGRFLADLADFSIAANRESDPALFAAGMPLHDPLAAAVALDPSLVTCFDIAMRVETETADGHGVRGRTTGDPVGLVDHAMPRTHVAIGVDGARFVGEFTQRLAGLCRTEQD